MPLPIVLVGVMVSGSVAYAARRVRPEEPTEEPAPASAATIPTLLRLERTRRSLRARLSALSALRASVWEDSLQPFAGLVARIQRLCDDEPGLSLASSGPIPAHPLRGTELAAAAPDLLRTESPTGRWLLRAPAPEAQEVLGGLRLSAESQAALAQPRAGGGVLVELEAAQVLLGNLDALAEAWHTELRALHRYSAVALADLALLLQQETHYGRLSEAPLPGAWLGARPLVRLCHQLARLSHTLASQPLLDGDGRVPAHLPQVLLDCGRLRRRCTRGLEEALFTAGMQSSPRPGMLIG